VLDQWVDAGTMQQIASENNLAETAFVVKTEELYHIRWFTPTVEVDLCGHATLASAYVIINYCENNKDVIHFHSERSGPLSVLKGEDGLLILDFPTDELHACEPTAELLK